MTTEELDHLAALRREGSRFSAVLGVADLTARVPGCGGWTVLDLAHHLGRVHRWAASNARAGGARGTRPTDPLPTARDAGSWYDERLADLLVALEDGDPPCWTFLGPATVTWWQRRQALETLVHRVDAEAGADLRTPLDAALAADGVAEVVDLLHPARLAAGAVEPPPAELVLATADCAHRWVVAGPPPGVAVTGPADALLLLVWGRTTLDDPALKVSDRARAHCVLAAPLTP